VSESSDARLAERVVELLDDARLARQTGNWRQLRALANAVLALDPHNAEAEALLAGSVQRRQMTLMFCDIVGSSAIADARDPEDMTDILRDYRRTCAEVIERFGGFIDDHQGDGMLVRFGYPEVHEDDARRAVLCGLEMIRALRDRTELLRVRVAVHTDLVVVDGVGVAGATTNEASRIQVLARPDTVVISDATHELVRGWFEVESMGRVDLRGVSRQVEVFTVLGEHRSPRRQTGIAQSPFTGRQVELALLAGLWRDAQRSWEAGWDGRRVEPRAVFVTGGAGIGKTRLVSEAARTLGAPTTECCCSSYHGTTSLYPFRPVLEAACQIVEGDDPARRLAKLREALGDDREDGIDLPFLAAALQIPSAAISPPPEVDPRKLREVALAAATRLVHWALASGPAMLFVDDLHWADQSTLDLLGFLLATPRLGLLVVLAARDGFEPPWPDVAERLQLGPLEDAELEEMARRMPEGFRLSEAQRSELVSRSDGVPLFMEELVRTADALDLGRELYRSVRYADYRIPAALRDPLLARLAATGVDLDLAQMAATIGREVDQVLLQQVAGLSDSALETRLDTLVGAGLVDHGDGAIRFRHEMIREAAYETQRRSIRRERHSRIADQLLGPRFAPVQGDAGEVAFHLERAERYGEAIGAHIRVAQGAQGIGAHIEATQRLTGTLDLLERLDDGAPRQQTELMVRELRSFSAVMAGGYAAPEAAEDYPRCVQLCESLGLAPELLPSLIRSWSYYAFSGNLGEADSVCATMRRVVDSGGLRIPVEEMGMGVVGFFRGHFGQARRMLEAFVAHPWAGSDGRPPAEWPLPNDPLTSVCAHLIPLLWIDGQRQAAAAMGDRALDRAVGLGFPYGPFSVGYVKSLLTMVRRLDGDHAGAARLAVELIELSERHGFTLWGLAGAIQHGIGEVQAGNHTALDLLASHVATWRLVLVAEVWTPYWLTELAVAQRAAGRAEDALHSLDEALAVAAGTGSDFYSSETLRVRGELRRERDDRGGLADLRAAVEWARHQGAPAFQSRAAASLRGAMAG
jgi:class 3 adenylate cyclase